MKTLIKTDGRKKIIDEEVTLEVAQKLVGGLVEMVHMPTSKGQILVNEEGLLRQLPYNSNASQITGINLVGDAILLTENDRWD